jgi:hypothetical protein
VGEGIRLIRLSQNDGVVGHPSMTNTAETNTGERADLTAIANEAELEIVAAEAVAASETMTGDAEVAYYEAELKSLRDAATTLYDAEHSFD